MKKLRFVMIGMILCGCIAAAVGMAFLFSNSVSERPKKGLEEYLTEGNLYLDDGEYMKAVVSYQKVLELEEDHVEALAGSVEAYKALQYYAEEEKTRELLSQAEPDNLDNWIGMVMLKMNLKQLAEAKQLAEELLEKYENEELTLLYHQMDIKDPVFKLEEGGYDMYQMLELEEIPDNAIVYYTTDGTDPDEYSTVYEDGIILSYPENVIKAVAISYLGYQSGIVEKRYQITAPVEEIKDVSSEFTWRVRDILHKDWDTPIYNYELAQFRSLYVFGEYNVYFEEQSNLIFYADHYQWYQSDYNTYGRIDLDMLSYMPFLETLVVGYQNSVDVEALSNLTYLKNLSLLNDGIENIQSLKNLKNLRKLALGWNRIADVSPLADLTQLVSLGLWDNQIQDVACLEGLEQLSYFDVSGNQVQSISCIRNMPELTELWISENRIADFAPIDSCHNLMVLMCEGNPAGGYEIGKEMNRRLIKTDMEIGGR